MPSTVKDASPRWLKDLANKATRAYATHTASMRPVPDFMVIGTKRGGTTSMFRYLLMHPGILGLYPQSRGKKGTEYFFRHTAQDDAWYRSHFHAEPYRRMRERRLGYRPLSGEASPYYLWDPRVAGRVHAVAPNIKAIVLLRDPVKRAWSHYQERVANGVEPLDFGEALRSESDRLDGELEKMLADPHYYSAAHDFYSYRARGEYLPQLQNWFSYFDQSQVLILRSEQMYDDVQATLDRVSDFLGLPRHELPTTKTFNSGARRPFDPAIRAELTEYFAAPNRALEEYLGIPLHWSSPTT